MQIIIKTLTGKTITIEWDPSARDTVLDVKRQIELKKNIPIDQQRLIIRGKELDDANLFSSYEPQIEGTIHLVVLRKVRNVEQVPAPTSTRTEPQVQSGSAGAQVEAGETIAQPTVKLLVLDVEGTIIERWEPINGNWDDERDENLRPVVDPSIPDLLQQYKNAGWTIVLATGTGAGGVSENLDRYIREFAKLGLGNVISANQPRSSDPSDGKEDKVRKFAEEYNVQNRARDIIFIDDAGANVERVQAEGFPRSYRATAGKPLQEILREHVPVAAAQVVPPVMTNTRQYARFKTKLNLLLASETFMNNTAATFDLRKLIQALPSIPNEESNFLNLKLEVIKTYINIIDKLGAKKTFSRIFKEANEIPNQLLAFINENIPEVSSDNIDKKDLQACENQLKGTVRFPTYNRD